MYFYNENMHILLVLKIFYYSSLYSVMFHLTHNYQDVLESEWSGKYHYRFSCVPYTLREGCVCEKSTLCMLKIMMRRTVHI